MSLHEISLHEISLQLQFCDLSPFFMWVVIRLRRFNHGDFKMHWS